MTTTHRALKPWCLREDETFTGFQTWKSNIVYNLKQDPSFAPFLKKDVKWTKTKTSRVRGLSAIGEKTAESRAEDLEEMLGCIANFCTVIARNSIIDDSKSLDDIWQKIRLYYGFHSSGANFLDFSNIKLEPGERNETLYQRMLAFINDNLLKADGTLTHDDETVTSDEMISPTLENLIVLLWLEKLHPRLPTIVKQKYATSLRSKTLYSLKPEISMAIPSLLEEAQSMEEARVMRLGGSTMPRSKSNYSNFNQGRRHENKRSVECTLCKQAGRSSNHFLSKCRYLPESDRKFLAKSRRIMGALEDDSEEEVDREEQGFDYQEEESQGGARPAHIRRVMVKTSPFMKVFHLACPVSIVLDTGAEADLIRHDVAISIGAKILKSIHVTTLADGKTPLPVIGEVHIIITWGNHQFKFSGLVVEDLDVPIIGGIPFLDRNKITLCTFRKEIILNDGTIYKYLTQTKATDSAVRRSTLVRAPQTKTLWPGDFLEIDMMEPGFVDEEYALEPRFSPNGSEWVEPAIIQSISGSIRIQNQSLEPKVIKKHDHIAQLVPTFTPTTTADHSAKSDNKSLQPISASSVHQISVDPDNTFSSDMKEKFHNLHSKYSQVFNPSYEGYNHAYGKFEAVVNMGNVKPPQRKGKLPQYSRDKLETVQEHFDNLERLGVLAKPEAVDVNVEYVNPSFLVKKSDNNFRLVTAFTEVGKYCKPQPTLLPTVDSTLRTIANWDYLIKTDLKSAYYQIPLSKESMKYCGTVSPFKGTRVYTRCAMGMPGSESALEELLSRVLGDLIAKGIVAKLADDLYVGGKGVEELLSNWEEVLRALDTSNLRLTEAKTVIGPKETTILGWTWREGQLIASPHKIASLSICSRPTTVKEMRSFLGAYKILARVIPKCSHFLQPLTRATAGKTSQQKIEWNEALISSFESAQKHLQSSRAIQLPREDDQLFVVTDGASAQPAGIGATLYVVRDGKTKLGGFFSQQLKPEQSIKWFPCEIEGLGIAGAVKFWGAYISQSKHTTKVLTDNKPCVDAYNKLCRGEFSSNARLSTFLTTVSRHHVLVSHLAGQVNLPSDFGSRNPVPCVSDRCQVCLFTTHIDQSVVRNISVADIKSGDVQMPFTNRKAWLATQNECQDLRRVKAQLQQGTRPSKKETTVTNVKRYLSKVTIASDGLLVVKKSDPLCPTRESIVVPALIAPGLLTALHIKLDHPSANELLTIADRSFFALNLSKVVSDVTKGCHTCASLAKIPPSLVNQSSSDPPEVVGIQFGCDVMVRERQHILVVREYVSSYTLTSLISSERHEDLRNALIKLLIGYIPLDGPLAVVRVDPAPGFKALEKDSLLRKHRIQLDLGLAKNANKNPVAERAVQELEETIQRNEYHNSVLTDTNLAICTARLNSKVRANGLSSREMFTHRDQFSHLQLPIEEKQLIYDKHASALKNHEHSESSKAKGKSVRQDTEVIVGDLVHLCSDKSKHHPRDRYIVTSINGHWCQVRKFVGSQLRSNEYKIPHEIYPVPSPRHVHFKIPEAEEDDWECSKDCSTNEELACQEPCVSEQLPVSSAVTPFEDNLNIPPEISLLPTCENVTDPNEQCICESAPASSMLPAVDEPTEEPVQPLRRSTRHRRPPKGLEDYEL